MNSKKYLLMVAVILLISFVSANGLTVMSDNSFTIEKVVDEHENITFILKNEEPFDFFNISFEDNLYIEMDVISSLSNGADVNVTALVIGNNDFVGEIRIKGFYEAQLGEQDITHEIDVDFGDTNSDSLSICDFTAIKGDQVIWTNLVSAPIVLRNVVTDNIVTTILIGESYQMNLDIPQLFRYRFERNGFVFTDVCDINILDDFGFVNNPDLDAVINLNLDVSFPPTTLEITSFVDSYNIRFDEEKDDQFLTIKNNGEEIARNIYLEGEWFKDFTKNDFTLASGASTNVGYTVASSGIFRTNQTDMTYVKNLTVTGNFGTISKSVDIYIKPANIGEDGNGTGGMSFDEWLTAYCIDNPDNTILCPQPKIIFKDGGGINDSGTTSEALNGLIRAFYIYMDKQDVGDNVQKELTLQAVNNSEQSLEKIESLITEVDSLDEIINSISGSAILLTATYGTIAIIAILLVLIYLKKRKNKFKNLDYY